MDREIYKNSIKYRTGQLVASAVWFAIAFVFIYNLMFRYTPTWVWHIESCLLILWLYYNGRLYKKRKIELDEGIDMGLKYWKEDG